MTRRDGPLARATVGGHVPGARLDSIQYLRAFAAFAVVYLHASIQLPEFERFLPQVGAFGVDLFFVISGFVLVHIARPGDTPLRFALRRARRVVPLYWSVTLLLALVLAVAPDVFRTTSLSAEAVAKSLLFVPYHADFGSGALQPLLGLGWTLNYEMYFYAVFALSLYCAPRHRVIVVAATIVVVFALCRVAGPRNAPLEFHGAAIVLEFVLGMALATLWRRPFRLSRPVALALAAVALACLVTLEPPALYENTTRLFHYGLPSFLLTAAVLSLEPPRWRAGVLLGDASYAIYLSHPFTLGIVRRLLPPDVDPGAGTAAAFVLTSVAACTIVGVAVHVFLERKLAWPGVQTFSWRW